MLKELGSLKNFLSSKEALMRAADRPPVRTREYVINRYVKLPVIENDKRIDKALKPKNVIKIKWLYENAENPIALRIELNGQPIKSNFSGKKLHDWLDRNSE